VAVDLRSVTIRIYFLSEPARFDGLNINYIKRCYESSMLPELSHCRFRLLPVIRRRALRFAVTQPFLLWRSNSRLLSYFSRLRLAWVSPGVVCGADPGRGLYKYPKRDFEVVFQAP